MEQKKTLFIIAAVGIFLAVVIGTACIIYSPSKKGIPTVATITPVEKKAPVSSSSGWTNSVQETIPELSMISEPEEVTNLETNVPLTANVKDLVVYSDNTTVYGTPQYQDQTGSTTIDLNNVKETTESKPANINITVNVSEKTATKVQNIETAPEKTVVETVKAPEPAPKKVTPAPEPAPVPVSEPKKVAKAPAKAPAKPAPKAEVRKAPEPKKNVQYWVQVAAFSNKKSAESARSVLEENKIPSDIFTYKDNKGNLFYRVRVGPYTTKSEGEYWRSRIMKISEFAKTESYVVSTEN